MIRRIGDEGHEYISHTWDHPSFTGASFRTMALGPAERRDQLERTDDLIRALSGRTSRPFFRPPFGDVNDGVLKDVANAGYDYTIMWTVDSLGWNRLPAAGIVERCLSRAEPSRAPSTSSTSARTPRTPWRWGRSLRDCGLAAWGSRPSASCLA